MNRLLTGAAAAMVGLAAIGTAFADTCPVGANTIYVTGSTALEAFLKKIGPKLHANGTTIVYENSGSCTGVAKVNANPAGTVACDGANNCFNGGSTTALTFIDDSTPNSVGCTVPVGGVPADLAISDVYASTCFEGTNSTLNVALVDTNGPINAFVFVVPAQSSQTAITAEEGYFVFGWPNGDGMAPPYNDDTLKFIRSGTSGTQILTTRSLTLTPPTAMKGTNALSTGGVITGINNQTTNATWNKAIGIAGADAYDVARAAQGANIKSLAFKWFKQNFAYFPDSMSSSRDKQNVRDGHYAIWGPIHMIGAQTGGTPTGKYAAFVNAVLTGIPDGANAYKGLDVQIDSSLVPSCAMKVNRTTDMGPLSPFTPNQSCECYFQSKTGGAPGSCQTCTTTCATGTCRNGFCEK